MVVGGLPVSNLSSVLEPQANFLFGRFEAIRTVDDVAANGNGIVETDGSRCRIERVGGSDHGTSLTDDVLSLPDHGNDRRLSVGHVVNKSGEEGFGRKVGVVLLGVSLNSKMGLMKLMVEKIIFLCSAAYLGRNEGLHGDKLVATTFEAGDDLADESTLDAIRLDGNESTLRIGTLKTGDRHFEF